MAHLAFRESAQLMRNQTIACAESLRIFFRRKFCERSASYFCNQPSSGAVECGKDGHVLEYLLRHPGGHHLASLSLAERTQITMGPDGAINFTRKREVCGTR